MAVALTDTDPAEEDPTWTERKIEAGPSGVPVPDDPALAGTVVTVVGRVLAGSVVVGGLVVVVGAG